MCKEEKAKLIHRLMSQPSKNKTREAIKIGKDGFPKIYAINNSSLKDYKDGNR